MVERRLEVDVIDADMTKSLPKPPATASTCYAPTSDAHRARRRPGWSSATRTWPRSTRLPHHQSRRPGPAAHPPPPRRPGPRPRADLHAGLLPRLAPTQSLGANDIHRRTPTPAGQPSRPRATLSRCRRQGLQPTRAQGNPLRSFRGLLAHLATLTRNQIRFTGTDTEIPMLADPTDDQRRAFMLIGTPIPLTAA